MNKYISKCTDNMIKALNIATLEVVMRKVAGNVLTSEFLLLGIMELEDQVILEIFKNIFENPFYVKNKIRDKILQSIPERSGSLPNPNIRDIMLSPEIDKIFNFSLIKSSELKDKFVGTGVMFLGLTIDGAGKSKEILNEFGIMYSEVETALEEVRDGKTIRSRDNTDKYDALNKFTTDLTKRASSHKLDPLIGRDNELNNIVQIMSRRVKRNPLLIGEPGVGKTAIIEGLAQLIVEDSVPPTLSNKRILSLDMARVVSGSKFKGDFEEKMKSILDEIKTRPNEIILFIDEIHAIMNTNMGGIEASNILKPAIAKGELQVIGATTTAEYKKSVEKDRAFDRRFQTVIIEPPTPEQTITILEGLKDIYQKFHDVKYSAEAIRSAVVMSNKYITEKELPDKAIDLIDGAGAKKHIQLVYMPTEIRSLEKEKKKALIERDKAFTKNDFEKSAKLQQKIEQINKELIPLREKWEVDVKNTTKTVKEEDIAKVVSDRTGISVTKLVETEIQKLKNMEKSLHKRLIGQDMAVTSVSHAIRRSRSGLKEEGRPIGSFMFLGPTGVGKTELAKALAEFMFDDENKMVRLDMSEYMESHSVSKMIGSPPGYVGFDDGGQLTEKIRRNPYSVILFDEMEKAHPDVFNMLLQILDDGRLTDSQGRTVSFKNTVIIGTSNIGTSKISNQKSMGFVPNDKELSYNRMKERIMQELKKSFRPEFINRIDDIIVFHSLEKEHVREILDLFIMRLNKKLSEKDLSIEFSEELKEYMMDEGYSMEYGARPMKRLIETKIENPLAMSIIDGEFEGGDLIHAYLNSENFVQFEKNTNEVVVYR